MSALTMMMNLVQSNKNNRNNNNNNNNNNNIGVILINSFRTKVIFPASD